MDEKKTIAAELISKFVHELVMGEADPGEIHVCPSCKGRLHVSIRIHTNPYWGNYLGAGAHCENCKATIASQGSYIPPWAKESEYKNLSEDELWKLMRGESDKE
jgi:C4-type Zn-finger protein